MQTGGVSPPACSPCCPQRAGGPAHSGALPLLAELPHESWEKSLDGHLQSWPGQSQEAAQASATELGRPILPGLAEKALCLPAHPLEGSTMLLPHVGLVEARVFGSVPFRLPTAGAALPCQMPASPPTKCQLQGALELRAPGLLQHPGGAAICFKGQRCSFPAAHDCPGAAKATPLAPPKSWRQCTASRQSCSGLERGPLPGVEL